MKKLLAMLLCAIMLCSVLASCGGSIPQDADDKGALIPVYMTEEIYNLDPAFAYLDDAGAKILGLIYEGLFEMDANGKPQKALCKSYTTGTNRDGEFYMEITLNDTKWSDGRGVSANDFVFAWKRIIEPEFTSEAASMLFDIKNARDCKAGLISIDDFGVVASETKVIEITFEREIDVDAFIETLCSPALVPLREDKVTRLQDWASYYATMATNGPFYPKLFEPGSGSMTLERSIYYYRDMESESQKLDAYVTPYQIDILFCTPEEALEKYNAGEIVYTSELPLAERANYADKVKTQDTLSTASYYFNTTKAPFDNADVRRAMSMAIDREELVSIVTYAKAAEGVVPAGVFNTTNKTSFRKEGGALISANANMDEAKSLIKSAGVDGVEFTIKIRQNQTDRAVAEYVKGVWEQLGFKIEIVELGYEHYLNLEYNQYHDLLREAYYAGDFDVIAIDMLALSTDAMSVLAPFAKDFSGTAMDLSGVGLDDATVTLPVRGEGPSTDTAAVEGEADSESAADDTAADTEAEVAVAEEVAAEIPAEEGEDTTGAEPAATEPAADEERVFETEPHITGYNNEEYNALIEQAFAETDEAKRVEILHNAEKILVEDMPIVPLFVYQDAYLISKDLKKVGTEYYAYRDFAKTTLKDYERFKEEE